MDRVDRDQTNNERIVGTLRELAGIVNRPDDPMLLGWPSEINNYRISAELAWSGQAVALLAFDPELHRQVVLKLFYGAASAKQQDSILAEGRTLAGISSPYVAQCYSVERYDGCPLLVLEYLDGTTLQDRPACDVSESLDLVRQLAAGLQTIHDAGVAHGDIKPANLIVDEGVPRFIDFGVATPGGPDDIVSSGTPSYCAPERVRGERYDKYQADIFSLGGVLYFLLTRRAPFEAATSVEARKLARSNSWRPIREYAPAVPRGVAELAERCLAADPADRFDSAQQLREAIEDLHRSRGLWWKGAAAVGVVAAVAALIWFGRAPTRNESPDAPANPFARTVEELWPGLAHPDTVDGSLPPLFHHYLQGQPTELPVTVSIIESGASTDLRNIPKDGHDRLSLRDKSEIQFALESDVECFVALVSVDFVNGRLEPVKLTETLHLLPGHTTETGILDLNYSGTTEYLFVLASNTVWDCGRFKDMLAGPWSRFRGIKRRDRPATEARAFRYYVKKKDD